MAGNEVEIVVKASDRSERTFAAVRRNAKKMLSGVGDDADGAGGAAGSRMGKSFLSMMSATLKPGAVAIATGFSAQLTGAMAAGLASGVIHVAQGFGAALALLPAAALAGGLALGTLKLALLGVGDALKSGLTGDTAKFEEALKGLSPAAQTVVREIVGVREQLDSLKHTVQDNFFGPLVGQVKPLADIYLRQLHIVLGDVATSLGDAGRQVSGLLQSPEVFRSLFFAMQDAGISVGNLTAGLANLVAAFIPLVTVGASFLPGLTDGFGNATARLAAFMQEAERTGALRDFIQRGIDAIKSLISTGAQVVRILQNIGDIGASTFEGLGVPVGGLLDKIEELSVKAKEFFATAEGQGVLEDAFALAKSFATAFLGTLQKVGEILAPIIPQIVELMTAFANLKTAILDAIEPAVHTIGTVLLPILTSLMNFLASNVPVVQAILIALFAHWVAGALAATAASLGLTGPFFLIGLAVGALVALIVLHWETIKNATLVAFNFVKDIIMDVFNWCRDNWPLLLIILTGPIGAAVVLITTHWETIKGAAIAVYNWIRDNWPLLLGILTGPIGWAVLIISTHWQTIKDGITAVKDWIGDRVDDIVDFFNGIPDRITDIGSQIKDKLTPSGGFGAGLKGAVKGLLPGLAHGGVVGAAGGGPRSGLTMVGEHGRELVRLPAGSRVHSNAMTEGMMGGRGGGTTTLVVDVRGDSTDLVSLIQGWIRASTGGDVQAALGAGAG